MDIKRSKCIILLIFSFIFVSCAKGKTNEIVFENVTDNEWDDKMLQEEFENYLINNNDIINFNRLYFHEFLDKYGEENVLCYYNYSEWEDSQNNYEHLIQLGLIKINENEYNILIEKYLLPFSEYINLSTLAKYYNGKYYFKTIDAWDNVVVGDFYFNNGNILLKMECEKSFNNIGKNFAGRQYGYDIYELTKGNYYLDKGKINR